MKTKKNKSRKNFSEKINRKRIFTKKHHQINGRFVSIKEGWKTIEVYGEPFQMGYAHGYLLAEDLKKIKDFFVFIVKDELKISFSQYLEKSNLLIKPILKTKYPDIYEEIQGISKGARTKCIDISVDFLISWNAFMSLYSIFENESIQKKDENKKQHCSAFIATGSATKNGDIVMAHNTHSSFIEGQFMNVIMKMNPDRGMPFIMQMAPGFVASVSDWFICESGIIGCETTIAYTNFKPSFGSPFFCRIREAMQYGKTLDQYVEIMTNDNAGDYACSWQFGNVNTGEIMLFELGFENYSIQRTNNGVFYGMNSAIDYKLRMLETDDDAIFDPKISNGSRNYRLNQLLNETYYGKISRDNAKIIISDHYDTFLGKKQMNGRTICKHAEENSAIDGENVEPVGAMDGKVVDTKMAKKMEFFGRFGSSCGRSFKKSEFLKKYPKYERLRKYLPDFPKTNWVKLGSL